ncbi:hypothetical protein BN1013_01721 [Candidatus Rubidus massiliensis]|nr:MAG: hypothetical protein BGO10_09060 [Chlamydia sp. 32-24]CDZ81190.1 hypothetical protein BN1013_01721 [Candidatus Rubidus massiliensis]
MRNMLVFCLLSLLITSLTSCAPQRFRTAYDVTPGNPKGEILDWRYGATDIRIQTSKITKQIMDRWFAKTGYDCICQGKPRIIITEIDNRTNCYIATDMVRDIIEGVAINDGRFTVVVGDSEDEQELNLFMHKLLNDPKYCNSSKPRMGFATAPQFLAKIRITKSVTSDICYDYEDYRMTVTLYDMETQEAIDSAWDVLTKKVRA